MRAAVDEKEFTEIVQRSRSMRQVILALGLVPNSTAYAAVRQRIARLGLATNHLHGLVEAVDDAEFAALVQRSGSIRQVLLALGVGAAAGGNYATVQRRIARLGLSTGHFHGQGHLRGKKNPWHPVTPLAEILVENSPYKGGTHKLKRRLLREGLLERKCYSCQLTEWLGKPIPLELEHKNGKRSDNRIINLTLLCPNCHAFTPTYRARNCRRKREQAAVVE